MATKIVEIRECDRCGNDKGVLTWRITGPEGVMREIELCERHGAAVANAFALGRAPASVKPARIPQRRRPASVGPLPAAEHAVPTPAEPQFAEPQWR